MDTLRNHGGIRFARGRRYHCSIGQDRKSTRLNSSHSQISYAVFCLKKKKTQLVDPVQFPFTRGVQPTMYRGRLGTMRQYAGFVTAEEDIRSSQILRAPVHVGITVTV